MVGLSVLQYVHNSYCLLLFVTVSLLFPLCAYLQNSRHGDFTWLKETEDNYQLSIRNSLPWDYNLFDIIPITAVLLVINYKPCKPIFWPTLVIRFCFQVSIEILYIIWRIIERAAVYYINWCILWGFNIMYISRSYLPR